MNCRKISGLLSAYMDAELNDAESRGVREHLDNCGKCRREYDTLVETKRLVASLAVRAPRTDLDELLRSGLEQAAPPSLSERLSYWWEENVAGEEKYRIRPHVLAATALFSVAGLWMATVTLDGPRDWHHRLPNADLPAVRYVRMEFSGGHLHVSTGVLTPVMKGRQYSAAFRMDGKPEASMDERRPLTSAMISPFGSASPPTLVSFGTPNPSAR